MSLRKLNEALAPYLEKTPIDQVSIESLVRLPNFIQLQSLGVFENPYPFLHTTSTQEQNATMKTKLYAGSKLFMIMFSIFDCYQASFEKAELLTSNLAGAKNLIYLERWLTDQRLQQVLLENIEPKDEDFFFFFTRQLKIIKDLRESEPSSVIHNLFIDIYQKMLAFRLKIESSQTQLDSNIKKLLDELETNLSDYLQNQQFRKAKSVITGRKRQSNPQATSPNAKGGMKLMNIFSVFKKEKKKSDADLELNSSLIDMKKVRLIKINGIQGFHQNDMNNYNEIEQGVLLLQYGIDRKEEFEEDNEETKNEQEEEEELFQQSRENYIVSNELEFEEIDYLNFFQLSTRKKQIQEIYGEDSTMSNIVIGKTMNFEKNKDDSIQCSQESTNFFKNQMKQKWYQNYRLDKLKKHGWDYLRSLIDVSRQLKQGFGMNVNMNKNLKRNVNESRIEYIMELLEDQSLLDIKDSEQKQKRLRDKQMNHQQEQFNIFI